MGDGNAGLGKGRFAASKATAEAQIFRAHVHGMLEAIDQRRSPPSCLAFVIQAGASGVRGG